MAELSITPAVVSIRAVTINGKNLPISVYNQMPIQDWCEDGIEDADWAPLWRIDRHPAGCDRKADEFHSHVLASNDGEPIVVTVPPFYETSLPTDLCCLRNFVQSKGSLARVPRLEGGGYQRFQWVRGICFVVWSEAKIDCPHEDYATRWKTDSITDQYLLWVEEFKGKWFTPWIQCPQGYIGVGR